MRKSTFTQETLQHIKKDMIFLSDVDKVAEKYGKTRNSIYSLLKRVSYLRDWQRVRNYNIAYDFRIRNLTKQDLTIRYNIKIRAVNLILSSTSLDDEYELFPLAELSKEETETNGSDADFVSVEFW